MRPPLNRLSLDSRYLLFIVSLGLLVIMGCWMGRIQKDPASDLPRVSQMSLEFAASPTEAEFLKQTAWGDEGTARARRAIYLDLLFLICYALLLSLACTFAAEGPFRQGRMASKLGLLLAWGSLVAGAADLAANLAMLGMLRPQPVSAFSLTVAKTFAFIQFTLIGMALAYIAAAMLLSLLGQGAATATRAE